MISLLQAIVGALGSAFHSRASWSPKTLRFGSRSRCCGPVGNPICAPSTRILGRAFSHLVAVGRRLGDREAGHGEAKRKLEPKQQRINDEIANVQRTFAGVTIEGILGNHRQVPLDECAHVYKDLDEVLAVLEGEGIARVAHRLYPVANIKGAD